MAYKRVEALKGPAETLHAELLDPERQWLKDVTVIGSGKNARQVTVL